MVSQAARLPAHGAAELQGKALVLHLRDFPVSVMPAGVGIAVGSIKFPVVVFLLTVYPSLRYPPSTILSEQTNDLLTGRGASHREEGRRPH